MNAWFEQLPSIILPTPENKRLIFRMVVACVWGS